MSRASIYPELVHIVSEVIGGRRPHLQFLFHKCVSCSKNLKMRLYNTYIFLTFSASAFLLFFKEMFCWYAFYQGLFGPDHQIIDHNFKTAITNTSKLGDFLFLSIGHILAEF